MVTQSGRCPGADPVIPELLAILVESKISFIARDPFQDIYFFVYGFCEQEFSILIIQYCQFKTPVFESFRFDHL